MISNTVLNNNDGITLYSVIVSTQIWTTILTKDANREETCCVCNTKMHDEVFFGVQLDIRAPPTTLVNASCPEGWFHPSIKKMCQCCSGNKEMHPECKLKQLKILVNMISHLKYAACILRLDYGKTSLDCVSKLVDMIVLKFLSADHKMKRILYRKKRRCDGCKRVLQRPLKCSGCHERYYCGVNCHKADWKKVHKRQCKRLFRSFIQPKSKWIILLGGGIKK